MMTPLERARLARHRARLRAAEHGRLPDWVDDVTRDAMLAHQRQVKQDMRRFDRLGAAGRAVGRAIFLRDLERLARQHGCRDFAAAEAWFASWLRGHPPR